jgi:hypothetical protein
MKAPGRRTVLVSGAAATAVLMAAIGWEFYSVQPESYLADDLSKVFADYREHALYIGTRYLQCTPHEANRETLASLLKGDAGTFPANAEEIRRYLRDRIRQDFAQDRITEVEGWLLSKTEVRLCAITTLSGGPHV